MPKQQLDETKKIEKNYRDNIFKEIFGNDKIFCQFLQGFSEIELFKEITAADIEDVSERFITEWKENRDCDTIKKIKLSGIGECYVIVLLEHQHKVHFLMSFRLLEYMVLIWKDYIKEQNTIYQMENKIKTKISDTKEFRLPLILPFVFYDGIQANWTASTNFINKIECPKELQSYFKKYIPNFEYKVINLNQYSYKELVKLDNILSLIFMVDKIKKPDQIKNLKQIPQDYLHAVEKKLTEEERTLLITIIELFLAKVNVPKEEIREVITKIEQEEVNEMFELLEGYDVQAERKEARLKGREEGREEGIKAIIKMCKKFGYTTNETRAELQEQFGMEEAQAEKYMELFWQI